MNHCTISYSLYDTDIRVKRYSELFVNNTNRIDAIAICGKNGNEKQNILNGVSVYYIQKRTYDEKNRIDYFLKIIKFFIKGSFLLLYKHIKYKYDIIHVHNVPDFLVFMAIIPKWLGAKIILDIHDVMPELYCEKFKKSFKSSLANMLLFLERKSVHFADFVIVANDLWCEKIINRNNISHKKCIALLNYPNLNFFPEIVPKLKQDSLKIIYPGHLSYHHGIDIAIKAFAIVKKNLPFATFDIYAHSFILEYRLFLKKLINKLNLEDDIHIYESIVFSELTKVFKNVDMGVVPKRGGIFASEAFSTKIFDFMAAGIPVVASKTKIDEYYFNDSMIKFFAQGKHEDMAEKVIELYHNPDERQRLSDNGLEFAKRNNWDLKKQQYNDVINSLLINN